jgi:hypothetical protein
MKIRQQTKLLDASKILLVIGFSTLGYKIGGFIGLCIFAGLTIWWSFTR